VCERRSDICIPAKNAHRVSVKLLYAVSHISYLIRLVRPKKPQVERPPRSGFVLSLISGVLIVVNLAAAMPEIFYLPHLRQPFIADWLTIFVGIPEWLTIVFLVIGAVSAAMVILGSNGLLHGCRSSGAIIIVFSTLSLCVGGGFMLGFILGVIGGSLGLAGV